MMCQAHFSPKVLHGKGRAEQHDLLHSIGLNWDACPTPQKRGVCIVKETYQIPHTEGHKFHDPASNLFVEATGTVTTRSRWVVDMDIPIFSQDKNYIEKYVFPVGQVP